MLLKGLAFALAVAGALPVGSFAMQPRVQTITRDQPIADFEVSSLNAQTRIFDVRVMRWTQRDGQDVVTPDDGFIVVPAVFSIEPYQTVIVRIQPRESAPAVEQSFKVVATGVVPGTNAPPPRARRLEAVVFISPAAPVIDPSFTLKATAPGQADLIVANHGNTHVYLGSVSIENAEREIYTGTIADYVLADSKKTFHLRVSNAPTGVSAKLTYDDAQERRQTASVTVVR